MNDVIEAFENYFDDIGLRIISDAKDGNLLGSDLISYRQGSDLNLCPLAFQAFGDSIAV